MSSDRYQNDSEVLARLKALRDAARIGIADVEAGRYRTFDSPVDLKRYLDALRDSVLSRKR
jgi:antitoxin ParD1/3/4